MVNSIARSGEIDLGEVADNDALLPGPEKQGFADRWWKQEEQPQEALQLENPIMDAIVETFVGVGPKKWLPTRRPRQVAGAESSIGTLQRRIRNEAEANTERWGPCFFDIVEKLGRRTDIGEGETLNEKIVNSVEQMFKEEGRNTQAAGNRESKDLQ